MSAPPKHHARQEGFLSWPIWLVYGALFAAGVPWYWPAEMESTLFGLPLWAAVSMGCSLAISIFTAWLLLTRWPQPPTGD